MGYRPFDEVSCIFKEKEYLILNISEGGVKLRSFDITQYVGSVGDMKFNLLSDIVSIPEGRVVRVGHDYFIIEFLMKLDMRIIYSEHREVLKKYG